MRTSASGTSRSPRGTDSEARELELLGVVFGQEPQRFRAKVLEFDRGARLRRAARLSGLLLGGALLSVPIPGWHLVGVPGFLVASVVLGLRRLRQDRLVESISGPCPACGEVPEIALPGTVRFPLTLPCPRCGEYLTLSEA